MTQFSLSPLHHRHNVRYNFATHDLAGQLTYQNIDLVIRGNSGPRSTQFLHGRGGRRGVVTLGRGNTGLYVTVRSYTDWGGWRFRACLMRD